MHDLNNQEKKQLPVDRNDFGGHGRIFDSSNERSFPCDQ